MEDNYIPARYYELGIARGRRLYCIEGLVVRDPPNGTDHADDPNGVATEDRKALGANRPVYNDVHVHGSNAQQGGSAVHGNPEFVIRGGMVPPWRHCSGRRRGHAQHARHDGDR